MVNNFEYIKKHMHFLNEKSFYFIQILKRKKENPEQKSYSRPIETFYIFDIEQLDRMMPHIIEKCEANRARAYIKMNCLDAESVMLGQITEITRIIRDNDWRNMPSSLNCACGQCGKQNGNEKLYLIDLDDGYAEKVEEIKTYINSLEPKKYLGVKLTEKQLQELNFQNIEPDNKIKMEVPTKNGIHLLTTGFDKQKFKQTYPKIDVHDDGITILYVPKSCDNIIYDKTLKAGDKVIVEKNNEIDECFCNIHYNFLKFDRGWHGINKCNSDENRLVCNVIREEDGLELRFPAEYIKKQ